MTHQHTDWLNRNNYTEEEREKMCIELLGEAQYWDTYQYVRHMSDKTKRPWVGLTDDECRLTYTSAMEAPVRDQVTVCRAVEAKLKEKNT
jgi:hypothetical protein